MSMIERIRSARGAVAAYAGHNPAYMAILDRIDAEVRRAEAAAMMAAPGQVVIGRRIKAQAA